MRDASRALTPRGGSPARRRTKSRVSTCAHVARVEVSRGWRLRRRRRVRPRVANGRRNIGEIPRTPSRRTPPACTPRAPSDAPTRAQSTPRSSAHPGFANFALTYFASTPAETRRSGSKNFRRPARRARRRGSPTRRRRKAAAFAWCATSPRRARIGHRNRTRRSPTQRRLRGEARRGARGGRRRRRRRARGAS